MQFFFSVKTTIYDYNSNVHDRRIPKIGKASPKDYHANEQPMSIFEGSWIFQCGKKHDSQGNFWKNVPEIKVQKFLFVSYVNLKTFLVVMFEITHIIPNLICIANVCILQCWCKLDVCLFAQMKENFFWNWLLAIEDNFIWFFYGMSCLNSPFFLDHWSCSYLHLFHGTIWEHQNDEKDLKGRYQF